MSAAGWLFLIRVAAVRPSHNLERRRSRSPDMAPETAALARDRNGMSRTCMRFGPSVQNHTTAAVIDMPPVEGILCAPASRGRDE
jgi:hypothetical protein